MLRNLPGKVIKVFGKHQLSRTFGSLIPEVKKYNICINSVFNGINITIDMVDDNPDRIRLFALRSFGESLCHSITDASLEFGFKAVD